MNREKRTTLVVAVLTFTGLSLISLVAWALTRADEGAKPAVAVPVAQAAEEGHVHPTDFETIGIDDFKKALDAGTVTVIDVRTIEQYKDAHLPGALQIPLTRVEGEIPYLPKDKLIVTYCTCPAEESSGQAAMILANAGIRAAALEGGLDAWTAKGYPTASGLQ